MLRDQTPDQFDAMLLRLAARAARRPRLRARGQRLCLAALGILNETGSERQTPNTLAMGGTRPAGPEECETKLQHAEALHAISESLGMAAEYAAFLAQEVERKLTRPPRA